MFNISIGTCHTPESLNITYRVVNEEIFRLAVFTCFSSFHVSSVYRRMLIVRQNTTITLKSLMRSFSSISGQHYQSLFKLI